MSTVDVTRATVPEPKGAPSQTGKKTASIWNNRAVLIISSTIFLGLTGTGAGMLATATLQKAVSISLLAAGVLGKGFVFIKWRKHRVSVVTSEPGPHSVQNAATAALTQSSKLKEQTEPAPVTATAVAQPQPTADATVKTAPPTAATPITPTLPPAVDKKDAPQAPISASEVTQKNEQDALLGAERQNTPVRSRLQERIARSRKTVADVQSMRQTLPSNSAPPTIAFHISGRFNRSSTELNQFQEIDSKLKRVIEARWLHLSQEEKSDYLSRHTANGHVSVLFYPNVGVKLEYDRLADAIKEDSFFTRKGQKLVVILGNPGQTPSASEKTSWSDLLHSPDPQYQDDPRYKDNKPPEFLASLALVALNAGELTTQNWLLDICNVLANRLGIPNKIPADQIPADIQPKQDRPLDVEICQTVGGDLFPDEVIQQLKEYLLTRNSCSTTVEKELPALVFPCVVPNESSTVKEVFDKSVAPFLREKKGRVAIALLYRDVQASEKYLKQCQDYIEQLRKTERIPCQEVSVNFIQEVWEKDENGNEGINFQTTLRNNDQELCKMSRLLFFNIPE